MGFLCDVHISYKTVNFLRKKGFDALHVNEILDGSRTKDIDICYYADSNDLIVISKDADFRDGFFLNNTPKKLIKVDLGNIPNKELIDILESHLSAIERSMKKASFMIELGRGDSKFTEGGA